MFNKSVGGFRFEILSVAGKNSSGILTEAASDLTNSFLEQSPDPPLCPSPRPKTLEEKEEETTTNLEFVVDLPVEPNHNGH